ncbi:MAG TPA: hypothetical protein VGI51_12265 [Steroidobacteraceae bacterium]
MSTALRAVVARGRGQGAFQASMFAENLRTAFDGAEYFRADWMPFVGRRQVRLGIGGIPWRRREMTEQKMIVFKP